MKLTLHDTLSWIDEELQGLAAQGLLRHLSTHDGPQQVQLRAGGRELLNFGSNDYLGLAADPRLASAVRRALETEGWGAGASPLVTGHRQLHQQLEERLAEFEDVEAVLLFTSGYAANLGTLAALAGAGDAIFSDAKNHASIIDGCRLSRATVHTFRHRDLDDLDARLRHSAGVRRRLIVTEAVFSMDGDLAPLVELADLAQRFQCMLVVDEAHATGVFGGQGRGLCEALGVCGQVDVRIGTLSKALGSAGGFVCGSRSLVHWLANRARSYIFSTAGPAAPAAAAMVSLDIVRDEPQRRIRLLAMACELRQRLRSAGWSVGMSESQIVPIIVGEADEAMRLSERLYELGVLVPAIRFPSVPRGEALLRVSLSAAHTAEMLDRLCEALASIR